MDFYNADEAPDQEDEDKYAAVRSARVLVYLTCRAYVLTSSGLRAIPGERCLPH